MILSLYALLYDNTYMTVEGAAIQPLARFEGNCCDRFVFSDPTDLAVCIMNRGVFIVRSN